MNNVFTYGSLMFEAVWSRVVHGQYRSAKAILSGYRVLSIREEFFPALIQGRAKDQVAGKVYLNIDNNDLMLLDDFEGDYYRREAVSIICDGKPIIAQTYCLRDEYHGLLDEKSWCADEFERDHLAEFIRKYLCTD